MLTQQELELKLKHVKPFLEKEFGIDKIGYFGSFAHGNYHENSDVDILVFYKKIPGWKFFALKHYLEDLFNKKIDLVTPGSLKSQLKEKIFEETKYI